MQARSKRIVIVDGYATCRDLDPELLDGGTVITGGMIASWGAA